MQSPKNLIYLLVPHNFLRSPFCNIPHYLQVLVLESVLKLVLRSLSALQRLPALGLLLGLLLPLALQRLPVLGLLLGLLLVLPVLLVQPLVIPLLLVLPLLSVLTVL